MPGTWLRAREGFRKGFLEEAAEGDCWAVRQQWGGVSVPLHPVCPLPFCDCRQSRTRQSQFLQETRMTAVSPCPALMMLAPTSRPALRASWATQNLARSALSSPG